MGRIYNVSGWSSVFVSFKKGGFCIPIWVPGLDDTQVLRQSHQCDLSVYSFHEVTNIHVDSCLQHLPRAAILNSAILNHLGKLNGASLPPQLKQIRLSWGQSSIIQVWQRSLSDSGVQPGLEPTYRQQCFSVGCKGGVLSPGDTGH